jgi:hypothetical protein
MATAGGVTKTVMVTLTVVAPPVSFAPSATAMQVNKGGSMPLPLTVKVPGPITAPVTLSANSLPKGVTATFLQTTFTSLGNYGTSVTIKAGTSATSGRYTFNLVATDGKSPFSIPIALIIP